jgi:hypothetical protein
MEPADLLNAGVEILEPVLAPHGFLYAPLGAGEGSGGPFASGEFRRDRAGDVRRLELHFRRGLGLVVYAINDVTLSHVDYMRALGAKAEYPGFPRDPLDGFRGLAHDLGRHAGDFLHGAGNEFTRAAA